jgi:16S rRNA (cytosine1402-N4)-methyltransferase
MTENAENNNSEHKAPHIPVMLSSVMRYLKPQKGETIIDGTFGAGGYSKAIMDTGANVLAIDRDPTAIANGQALVKTYEQLNLVEGKFSNLDDIAKDQGHDFVDGVVLDVGVSSMQLDQAERGFSFQVDGPLDMRMSMDSKLSGPSAADLVNRASQSDLIRIIGILGEDKHASKIARAICTRREEQPFERTLELVDCIEKVNPRRAKDKRHPATQTFQALRIFINRELDELANALFAAEEILRPGGRLVVVSFHSLEDRIVKRFLADRAQEAGGSRHLPAVESKVLTFEMLKRGTVAPSHEEIEGNPRARSAKLRAAKREDVAPLLRDLKILGMPNFSSFKTIDGKPFFAKNQIGEA